MNNKIIAGIIEDLEFERHVGGYAIRCSNKGGGSLSITIEDFDPPYSMRQGRFDILKDADEGKLTLRVVCDKSIWYKSVPSWGWLVDNADEAVAFIVDSCSRHIRHMK